MKKDEVAATTEEFDGFDGIDWGELADLTSSEQTTLIDAGTGQSTQAPKEKEDDIDAGIESALASLIKDDEAVEDTSGSPPPTKDTKSDKTDKPIENAASSSTTALAIAKAFYEEGGLSDFDEEEFNKIATEESPAKALMTMIQKEVEANVEEYKKNLDPTKKAEIEAKEMGIDPQEYTQLQADIQILENVSDEQLDSPEARETILRYYYQATTKFSEERINKEIKRLEDLEEAKDEVKSILPDLIENRKEAFSGLKVKADEYKKSLVEKENKRINDYKTAIAATTEIIPGNKINKTTQAKIEDMILKPVKESNGQKLNAIWAKREADPIKFDTIMAYLMIEGVFDGKWGGITAKPKTKAFEELENSLRTQRATEGTSINNLTQGQKDALSEMKGMFGNK